MIYSKVTKNEDIMVELFVRKDVAFRAFKIALIVGVILAGINHGDHIIKGCLLYTSPSPRDRNVSRMPSSA